MPLPNFRYLVIGTVPVTPWAYYQRNAQGEVIKDAEGRPILEGLPLPWFLVQLGDVSALLVLCASLLN